MAGNNAVLVILLSFTTENTSQSDAKQQHALRITKMEKRLQLSDHCVYHIQFNPRSVYKFSSFSFAILQLNLCPLLNELQDQYGIQTVEEGVMNDCFL